MLFQSAVTATGRVQASDADARLVLADEIQIQVDELSDYLIARQPLFRLKRRTLARRPIHFTGSLRNGSGTTIGNSGSHTSPCWRLPPLRLTRCANEMNHRESP